MVMADIIISNAWFTLILVIAGIILFIVYSNFKTLQKKHQEKETSFKDAETKLILDGKDTLFQYQAKLIERDNEYQKKALEFQTQVNVIARAEFEKFKQTELQAYIKVYADQAIEVSKNLVTKWKIEEEEKIRKDAVTRSLGVNLGKITEHLIPFSEEFKKFNSKDARFIGSPIDLIVFDGISDNKPEIAIYFIEVKSGGSNLSPRQKKIRDAIASGNIYWWPITVDEFDIELGMPPAQDGQTST
jgi:predicted Holliday junction resolvase-like endonuclease